MNSLVLFFPMLLVALAVLAAVFSPRARSFFFDLGDRVSQAMFHLMCRNGLVLGGYSFPEGSKFYFSRTFAAAKDVTILSNADPANATATAHGYSLDDEILLTSGWEDATDSVFRVADPDTNTFDVAGLFAADTDWFPAGTGIGSAQKISSWVEIPQILGIAASGGDPRFTTISPLAKRNSINVPTGFNAQTLTLTLGHDPANANYVTMLAISRKLEKVAFKQVLRGGGTTYGYGYMAVSEFPTLNAGQANSVTAALALLGRSVSYEA